MFRLGPRKLSKAIYQCLERSRLLSRRGSQESETLVETTVQPLPIPQSFPYRGLPIGTPRAPSPVSIDSTMETPQEVMISTVETGSVLCVDDNSLNRKVSRREDSLLVAAFTHAA
jgi:hypothetical protein